MDTWQGAFGWQGYALEGRPDVLNYLRAGDVTWEAVWAFYRGAAARPEAVQRLTGLFHAATSAAYDQEGCHLDEEGEIRERLAAWAAFAAERDDLLPEAKIQEVLARLAADGLISDLYYRVAYSAYMEATLERYAARWRAEPPAEEARAPSAEPAGSGLLPVYYPAAARFPTLREDAAWEHSMRAFLGTHYHSWNRAYTAAYATGEELDLFQESGGEG